MPPSDGEGSKDKGKQLGTDLRSPSVLHGRPGQWIVHSGAEQAHVRQFPTLATGAACPPLLLHLPLTGAEDQTRTGATTAAGGNQRSHHLVRWSSLVALSFAVVVCQDFVSRQVIRWQAARDWEGYLRVITEWHTIAFGIWAHLQVAIAIFGVDPAASVLS